MRKFSLGDFVHYTNKNMRLDVRGTIIASTRHGDYHMVQAESGTLGSSALQRHISWNGDHRLDQYFENRAVNSKNSLSNKTFWVGDRSRNLKAGYNEIHYDPSQNGDTDDDI